MPIFITAEIGINHNGNIKICKELIDVAKHAGCNAVKFQKRDIVWFTQQNCLIPLESPWGTTQRDQKLGLELSLDDYREIDSYCKTMGSTGTPLPGVSIARNYSDNLP